MKYERQVMVILGVMWFLLGVIVALCVGVVLAHVAGCAPDEAAWPCIAAWLQGLR